MTDSAHSDLFLHPSNQTSCVIEEVFDDEQPQTSSTNTHEASTEAAAASETEAQQKTPTPHDLEQRDATASAQGEDHPQAGTSTSGKQDPEQQPSTSAQQQQQATQEQQQEAASDSVGQPVDPQLQQLLDDCERLKQEGNAAYGRGDYDEALQLYWQVGARGAGQPRGYGVCVCMHVQSACSNLLVRILLLKCKHNVSHAGRELRMLPPLSALTLRTPHPPSPTPPACFKGH